MVIELRLGATYAAVRRGCFLEFTLAAWMSAIRDNDQDERLNLNCAWYGAVILTEERCW